MRSWLWFARTSVNVSLASGNPIRSNFPIKICGSDSLALKSAKRRLDEPLLMVSTERIACLSYVTIKDRVVPASKRGDLLDLSRPPSVRLIFKDRCSGPQHRVNDP